MTSDIQNKRSIQFDFRIRQQIFFLRFVMKRRYDLPVLL